MKIINPFFKVNPEKNIFTIREREFATIEEKVREMLIPTSELGFELKEFEIRNSRFSSGELSRTIKQNMVIKLQKGSHEIDLSLAIPKLVDRNYIIINGRKKIPQFQLFDIPIVNRGKSIKLRTNVATMVILENKEEPFVTISLLGRKLPLALVMLTYHGMEEMNRRYDLVNMTIHGSTLADKLMHDLKTFYDASEDMTEDDFLKEVGRYYSKYNAKVKGEDLIYALGVMLRIDIMSRDFFQTDSVLDELVEAIKDPSQYDDTDYKNKRIRCIEYMILGNVAKAIFDLCMSNRTARQPKFNINSTQILSECNVSDVVQFNFSINPIDEITKLSRMTLVGPGGFKRDNIPEYLRDICPSMFGRACPVDTPDRDNCGVLQNLLPNSKLDDKLQFTDEILEKQPVSAPVSMVPFLEHDDQTRLQMASSQMRQAIMLKKFDPPMIQSGCEGLYSDYSHFVKKAQKNGEVVYLDSQHLIVVYEDKSAEVFDIAYRKIYVENLDIMKVYVKVGNKFKQGDILAESLFCDEGRVMFGKNLLTGVMIYYGHNYEDGIVISDRLVKENVFTSIHYRDLSFTIPPNKILMSLEKDKYKPLPTMYDFVEVGDPYAIIKEVPITSTDYCTIFSEEDRLKSTKRLMITEVNLYPNAWNTDIPEFNKWVEEKIEEQQSRHISLKKAINKHLPKEQATQFIRERGIDKFSNDLKDGHGGNYRIKGEKINGIHVEMFAIYRRPIELGDKIANRHGNKGVIAQIVPQERMPKLNDGRSVDICINPLGIISRMNIGQLFELHLSMSLFDLKRQLNTMLEKGEDQRKIKKHLLGFIVRIDNTEGGWYIKQFAKGIPKIVTKEFIDEIHIIQPPFESITMDMAKEALKYTNTPFEYEIYDPVSKENFLNTIAAGYIYFFRMVHIAEERLAARGIGSYARRTLQPLAGRKNRGGQRCGEMETACLIAHDGMVNLSEFLTTKSDCIDLKNNLIKDMIETDSMSKEGEDSIVPESVKLLDSYLIVAGVTK